MFDIEVYSITCINMAKKPNKKEALKTTLDLVETFLSKESELMSKKYKEDRVRKDFIDKFFKSLGWDMYNDARKAERRREVTHEDTLKIEGKAKAPDYGFRIGQKLMFYVEAKAPHINLAERKEPAYQVRLYGYNRKLPISILTDFEEFAIYDTKIPPKENDDPSIARIFYCKYTDYEKNFDKIYNWCSYQALTDPKSPYYKLLGKKSKKGVMPIDVKFLNFLDNCRDILAHEIANRNKSIGMTEKSFNKVVQLLLDRIIFLRIAEDRNIEKYGQLLKLTENEDILKSLDEIFNKSIAKYNSSLFEKGGLIEDLNINDNVLKKIIKGLYYPNPYEFSALSVEILGSIYERFLGNVIRVLPAGGVTIEKKPAVQKAGGVFYTPEYVVDYIVNSTLGKKIEKLSPTEVAKIKILDPACGSGSFLISAYDYLLNWHLSYYTKNKGLISKSLKAGFIYEFLIEDTESGKQILVYKLTIEEKKKILLNSIFGVDIDEQAVEVTKLSLLLKMLEDESSETAGTLFESIGTQILPDLSKSNIKSGNSLIQEDFFKTQQPALFDATLIEKLNVFNWSAEGHRDAKTKKYIGRGFPNIMKSGGFDVIIGNPPWGAELNENELEYCRNRYQDIVVRMIDSFMYFCYMSTKDLLKTNGSWGMILPDVVLYQIDNRKLRSFFLDELTLTEILNMGDVFEVNRPSAIIIGNKANNDIYNISAKDLTSFKKPEKALLINQEKAVTVSKSKIKGISDFLFLTRDIEHYSILDKIRKSFNTTISDITDQHGIQRGVSPDLKEAFIVDSKTATKHKLEKSHLKMTVTGGIHVKRYYTLEPRLFVIYTSRKDNFNKLPNIKKYIKSFQNEITCTEVKDGKHPLYALHRPRDPEIFTKSKIIGVITEDEIIVDSDDNNVFASDGCYVFGVKEGVDRNYALAILNSNLYVFLYRLFSIEQGRMLSQVKPTILNRIPFLIADNKVQSELSDLVENIKSLNKKIFETKVDIENNKKHLSLIENEINDRIYCLYELEDQKDFIESTLI